MDRNGSLVDNVATVLLGVGGVLDPPLGNRDIDGDPLFAPLLTESTEGLMRPNQLRQLLQLPSLLRSIPPVNGSIGFNTSVTLDISADPSTFVFPPSSADDDDDNEEDDEVM